ncbi:MAG: DUF6377 domain-containing protein [Tannerella sp.]|jgi:cell shape-determining protein MreC|nr:DUF6377 domain-containing protein [Tannerella sp.]
MKTGVKKLLFIGTIMIIPAQILSAVSYKPEIESLLLKLDSLIENKDFFIKEKEDRIGLLRKRIRNIRTTEEQYWINKAFYDEFFVYNADSALYYAEQNIRLSKELDKKEGEAEWMTKKSFILSATGMLKEALDIMNEISLNELSPLLKTEYYRQMIYLYSHFGQYSGENGHIRDYYLTKEESYKDSIFNTITKDDPYYLWHEGWRQIGASGVYEVKSELEKAVLNSGLDSRLDAMNAYVLAVISREMGNPDDFLKYIAYSAMADVKTANKDIASLEELAIAVYDLGDIDRAYTYINYCLQNAQLYRNRIRVIGISSLQNAIHMAYREINLKQEARLRIFLIIVSILSIILIAAIIYISRQMKWLSKSRSEVNKANQLLNKHVNELSDAHKQLSEVNNKLKLLNEQLQEANSRLRESNYVKEEYIGYVFTICSGYISKMDDFRKNINRKIKTNKIEDIKTLTDIPTMAQNELKEFYHNFDAIFLNLYPDFVNDFNRLLHPDKRFLLKDGELLSAELRIYALVRLGIDSSVKIAEFLHCSTQTVYNYRLKTRNKAIVPKEKFADLVKSLGKIQE